MELLITDLTEMNGGKYCVAGWDGTAEQMFRPLPNGDNWTQTMIAQHAIAPGTSIGVTSRGASNSAFPHRTEDTPIVADTIQPTGDIFSDWLGDSAPTVSPDLAIGFDGYLQWNSVWDGVRQGVYIAPGTRCRSLLGIRVEREALAFSEVFGKLKATLNDGSHRYQLAVSSKALKEAWRTEGFGEVTNALPRRNVFHARIGLARAFGSPSKCYAMLNGVL
jgi:hypothetical protein